MEVAAGVKSMVCLAKMVTVMWPGCTHALTHVQKELDSAYPPERKGDAVSKCMALWFKYCVRFLPHTLPFSLFSAFPS